MPPASSSTLYSSRRIVQLPTVCRSESCANNLMKLVNLPPTSYLLSSTPLASSSTSYLSHLTCYHPCRQHPHRYCTRRVVLNNFPLSVALRAALTIYEARRSSHRVLLAVIYAAGILIDIVLVTSYLLSSMPPASSLTLYSSRRIVQLPTMCRAESCANNLMKLLNLLAMSYLLSSKPLASSLTPYSSRLTCYHPCRQHPHRLCTRRVILKTSNCLSP